MCVCVCVCVCWRVSVCVCIEAFSTPKEDNLNLKSKGKLNSYKQRIRS